MHHFTISNFSKKELLKNPVKNRETWLDNDLKSASKD